METTMLELLKLVALDIAEQSKGEIPATRALALLKKWFSVSEKLPSDKFAESLRSKF